MSNAEFSLWLKLFLKRSLRTTMSNNKANHATKEQDDKTRATSGFSQKDCSWTWMCPRHRAFHISTGGFQQPWEIGGAADHRVTMRNYCTQPEAPMEEFSKAFQKLLQFSGNSQKLPLIPQSAEEKWVDLNGSSESRCDPQTSPQISYKSL